MYIKSSVILFFNKKSLFGFMVPDGGSIMAGEAW